MTSKKIRSTVFMVAAVSAMFVSKVAIADDPPDFGVILCSDRESDDRSPWDVSILRAMGSALGRVGTIGVKRSGCDKTSIFATCFGAGRMLQCNVKPLERVFRAAAWYAWAYREEGVLAYEDFYRISERMPHKAFMFADRKVEQPDAESFAATMVAIDRNPDADADEDEPFYPVYDSIARLALAPLLGHEAGHLENETCPISNESRLEEQKFVDLVLNEHRRGTLFCAQSIDVNEFRADICALRRIRKLVDDQASLTGDGSVVGDFVRRAASEIAAFQALTGYADHSAAGAPSYQSVQFKEYLGAPYRQLVLAAEMNGGFAGPAVCGNAARLFVHGVQLGVTECQDGGQEVSDPVLALLPRGVEKSWNGAPWTAESVSCKIDD